MFGCAWMVCTTARIAVKPAMSLSPRAVTTESHTILMRVDADPRLAAAVGAAARWLAEAAGTDEETASVWQRKVVMACQEAFRHPLGEVPRIDVKIARLVHRIEVALTHSLGITRLTQEISQPAVR